MPNLEYVTARLAELEKNGRFYGAERAVALVFRQWPMNTDFQEVLVKTTVLNRLYSTNIYDVWSVAQHIVNLGIDEALKRGNQSLVNEIAGVRLGTKPRYVLSFATKYCSWHEPDKFQIYDSRVEKMLWLYKKHFAFCQFRRKHLRDYPRFIEIVDNFKSYFALNDLSRKEVDKFLYAEAGPIAIG
jgi:hypothetical protein